MLPAASKQRLTEADLSWIVMNFVSVYRSLMSHVTQTSLVGGYQGCLQKALLGTAALQLDKKKE